MTTTVSPAFASAHSVSHWIHRRTTDRRTNTHPPCSSGLANDDIHVVGISDLSDCRTTLAGHSTNLSRRQRNLCPLSIASVHDCRDTGTPAELTATPRLHFDIVNRHSGWDIFERQAVTHLRLRSGTAMHLIARL
jgi:hypothetical protein